MRWSVFYFICIIATMVGIFMFSAENYENTMETSDIIVKPIEETVKKNTDKTFKNEEEEKKYWKSFKAKLDKGVRKSAHAFIFGLLGMFSVCFFLSLDMEMADAIMCAIFLCILYGASDEIHQKFTKGRDSRFTDVCIDGFGSWIGISLVYIGLKIKSIRKKRGLSLGKK